MSDRHVILHDEWGRRQRDWGLSTCFQSLAVHGDCWCVSWLQDGLILYFQTFWLLNSCKCVTWHITIRGIHLMMDLEPEIRETYSWIFTDTHLSIREYKIGFCMPPLQKMILKKSFSCMPFQWSNKEEVTLKHIFQNWIRNAWQAW